MAEYYRVRTPEQWDWLMEHLELEYPFSSTTFLTDSIFMDLKDDQQLVPKISIKSSNINKIIEVSKLMEEEKMEKEDYITIEGGDLLKIKNEDNCKSFTYADGFFHAGGLLYTLDYFKELHIPKSLLYPKVRMSVAEKKEFDELKKEVDHASEALSTVRITDFGESDLARKIYRKHELSELDFARAWADPSLIEVIPDKKWNVRVPISCNDAYYNKVFNDCKDAVMVKHDVDKRSLQIDNNFKFTAEEIKYYHLDNDLFEKVEVTDDGTK